MPASAGQLLHSCVGILQAQLGIANDGQCEPIVYAHFLSQTQARAEAHLAGQLFDGGLYAQQAQLITVARAAVCTR